MSQASRMLGADDTGGTMGGAGSRTARVRSRASAWGAILLSLGLAIGIACGGTEGDAGSNDAGRADGASSGTSGASGSSSGTSGTSGASGSSSGDGGQGSIPWTVGPAKVDPNWLTTPPACDKDDWAKKYFIYRKRFIGDGTAQNPGFVSVGTGPGQSMPATFRDADADCANDWQMSGCTKLGLPNTKGLYGWGDTTIWLGWYLLNLATEFKTFQAWGVPTTQTTQEIYNALVSFNRLDTSAETVLGYPSKLDGFFLRTDVNANFIWQNYTSGAPRFPRSDNGLVGYGCLSAGGACPPQTVADGDFVSQDQVIGMLLGIAFIDKYIPNGTVVSGMDLRHEARAIVHRMVKHLRDNSWKVTGPDGSHPPDAWGGNALGFADQFAQAANHLAAPDFGITNYADALSSTAGLAGMIGADASWDLQTATNRSLAIKLAIINNVWNQQKIAARATSIQDPIFAVVHALLWNVPLDPSISAWEFDSQLAKAPCGGPCKDSTKCENAPGWMGAHRIKDPENRGGSINGGKGEYNGMDYIATLNLYSLLKGGKLVVTPRDIPASCTQANAPGAFLGNTDPLTTNYDPRAACAEVDMHRTYCGRSFASWMEAAYRGEATIFTGSVKWTCAPDGACTFSPHGGKGTKGADLYIGTSSGDAFDADDGNDCLYGMGGDDHLKGGLGRDELHGGDGNDELCGETCSTSETLGDSDLLFGDAGNDTLNGGPQSDELFGGDGNDKLSGGGGDDFLYGEAGDDVLAGGDGRDLCEGGDGNDTIYGDAGDDRLLGGAGRDKLSGGDGNDVLAGGPGNDFLMGGGDDDTMWGEDGDDRLCGGCGGDFLNGGYSGLDACRATKLSLDVCINADNGNNVDPGSCGNATLSDADCSISAFDAW